MVVVVVIVHLVMVVWRQKQKLVGVLMPNQDPLQQQQWVVEYVELAVVVFDM